MKSSPWRIALATAAALAVARAGPAPAAEDAPVRVAANRLPTPEALPSPQPPPESPSAEDRPIVRREERLFARPATGTLRAESGADTPAPARTSGWMSWWRSLGPLALVLAVIGVIAAAAKRLAPRRLRAGLTGAGAIEVLGRQYLSPKQSVAMLKVGRRILLLGMTPDRLTHLETIADADEVAELVGRTASGRPDSLTSTFHREVLSQASAYDPGDDPDGAADRRTAVRAATYAGTRDQLRGLLDRVRSLSRPA